MIGRDEPFIFFFALYILIIWLVLGGGILGTTVAIGAAIYLWRNAP